MSKTEYRPEPGPECLDPSWDMRDFYRGDPEGYRTWVRYGFPGPNLFERIEICWEACCEWIRSWKKS